MKEGRSTILIREPERSYTFTITSNRTFKVYFTEPVVSYTVTSQVIPAGAGVVTGHLGSRPAGSATVTAEANPGYEFSAWVDYDGVTAIDVNPSLTIDVQGDTVVRALFTPVLTPRTVTATVNVAEYGTAVLENLTTAGSSSFNDGDNARLTVTPASGYYLSSIVDGETPVFSGSQSEAYVHNFTVSTDHAFSVVFTAPITYTVSKGSNNHGFAPSGAYSAGCSFTINGGDGPVDVVAGNTVTLHAEAAAGYYFTCWSTTPNPTGLLAADATTPDYTYTVTGDVAVYAVFQTAPTYSVAATNTDGHGTATVSPTSVASGATATFTATADECYAFAGWYNGETLVSSETPYTATITAATTLEARFSQLSYTVTVGTAEGGSAELDGVNPIACGTAVSLTATPATGYHFVRWSNGSTVNPLSLTVTADVTISPVFALDEYTVTLGQAEGGSATFQGGATGSTVVSHGTEVTVVATPDECYTFNQWSDASTEATHTVVVTGNLTLTPSYSVRTHSVTVGTAEGGSAVASTASVECDGTVTFTATPATGYHFVQWSDGNTANPYNINNVRANINISPVFAANVYTLSVATHGNGDVNSSAEIHNDVAFGSPVSLTANPAAHYHFTGWTGDMESTDNPLQFNMGNAAVSLTANFEPDAVVVNVAVVGEGTVNGNAAGFTVNTNYDGTVTLTAATDACHTFSGWSGAVSGTDATVTVPLTADVINVTATFTTVTYTVSATGEHGTFTFEPSATADCGTTVTVTAHADEGYRFVEWTDNHSTDNNRTVTLSADVALTAAFELVPPTTYAVVVTVVGEGTVNGNGTHTYTVTEGDDLTLTASPAADYTFSGWSGDATGTDASLTVTPTADMAITATFVYSPVTYTVAASAYPANAGSVSGADTYVHDATVTLTATPEAHYTFSGWYEGGALVSEDITYTFTATAARTLEARFSAIAYTVTATANPAEYGRVETSGSTTYGAIFRINAIANNGYRFVQWNDGNTTASRNISVTGNAAFVAYFEELPAPVPVDSAAADVLTYLDSTRRVVTGIREDLRAHLTTVRIPATVERIANRAFVGANALTNVTIPATVDTIGDSAFYMLPSLVSINLPGSLRYLGSYAFYSCQSLQSVSMPADLDTLRQRTFAECSALRRIEIPATVKEVGAYALYNCDNIYQLTIPASVDTVRQNAFYNMNGLRFVTIEGGNHHFESEAFRYYAYWWGDESYGSIQLTSFRGTLAEWLTNTFADKYANPMMQSSNFAVNGEIVTDLVIPAGTDTIRDFAFYNDDQLVSITIPASVDTIGAYAFAHLGALERIVLLGIPKVNDHSFDNVSNDVIVMVPCETLDSIRDTGWSHFDKFYANGVPVLTFRNSYGGRATVLQEPSCSDFTARFEATPGENYTFKAWSDGDTTNPRTMVLDQDETIGAIWERIPAPTPLESKTISFDQPNTDANWYLEDGTANKWYIGRGSDVAPRTGTSYLYISNDGGATNSYSYYSDAYTYTELYLSSGTYRMRFHWQGDGNYPYSDTYGDYLKAYLLADGVDVNFDDNSYYGDAIVLSDTLVVSDIWIYQNAFVNVPTTGWYKMVFYWRNQYGSTGNPGAAVDNIYIQFQDEDVLDEEHVTLRVVSADTAMGTVSGSGLYTFNEMVTVSATAKEGYQFSHWSDGNTEAVRSVRAGDFSGSNQQLVAYFGDREWQVTLHVSPDAAATAQTRDGRTTYNTNEEVALRVVEPQAGYAFMGWSTDGSEENIVSTADAYVFNITSDVELTAVMRQLRDTIWVVRTVNGPGDTTTVYYNENPQLGGSPMPTPDGALNPFGTDGNIELVEVLEAKIYSAMGQIVVDDADGYTVSVYDVNGRRLASKQDVSGRVVFDVPASGTYMVKIGNLITKKVVVVR